MNEFESWLGSLERQIDRLPALHGDHAGVKAELRRLVAYARSRAGAPEPAPEPVASPAPINVGDNSVGAHTVEAPAAPEPEAEPAPTPSDPAAPEAEPAAPPEPGQPQ